MSLTALITAASLGLVSGPAEDPSDAKAQMLAQAQPTISTQGSTMAPRGDYMTTPQGCTYRRTQAPGYPERWILIVNPQQLGLPTRGKGCKGMM